MVAFEVKALANQTAKATEEIAAQVRAIQEATDTSAQAIGGIAQTINQLNEISTAIASAVEEQECCRLQEISRNVSKPLQAPPKVASTSPIVTQASQQTSAGSTPEFWVRPASA